jgi:hypothetical protein
MKPRRLFIVLTACLFLGWLGWLARAVDQRHATEILSRAQLAAASQAIIADVSIDASGLPNPTITNAQVLWTNPTLGKAPDPPITRIPNLSEAQVPTGGFPGAGKYLLLIGPDGIVGLPRSPGFSETKLARPIVYRWNPLLETQFRTLIPEIATLP